MAKELQEQKELKEETRKSPQGLICNQQSKESPQNVYSLETPENTIQKESKTKRLSSKQVK